MGFIYNYIWFIKWSCTCSSTFKFFFFFFFFFFFTASLYVKKSHQTLERPARGVSSGRQLKIEGQPICTMFLDYCFYDVSVFIARFSDVSVFNSFSDVCVFKCLVSLVAYATCMFKNGSRRTGSLMLCGSTACSQQ